MLYTIANSLRGVSPRKAERGRGRKVESSKHTATDRRDNRHKSRRIWKDGESDAAHKLGAAWLAKLLVERDCGVQSDDAPWRRMIRVTVSASGAATLVH